MLNCSKQFGAALQALAERCDGCFHLNILNAVVPSGLLMRRGRP